MNDVQIWCDHCNGEFETAFDEPAMLATCPECAETTLAVLCEQCGERSEIAHSRIDQTTWICPTCKEQFELPPQVISERVELDILVHEPVARPATKISPWLIILGLTLLPLPVSFIPSRVAQWIVILVLVVLAVVVVNRRDR